MHDKPVVSVKIAVEHRRGNEVIYKARKVLQQIAFILQGQKVFTRKNSHLRCAYAGLIVCQEILPLSMGKPVSEFNYWSELRLQ